MKGTRYPTEAKLRLLREADRGEKSIQNLCREANISEVGFHRWKRQFGHLGINETRRLKELEAQLRKELLELSVKYPRYGYRRIAALRRRQGWRVGKRHIQRLRRAAGLRVPTDEAEDNPA